MAEPPSTVTGAYGRRGWRPIELMRKHVWIVLCLFFTVDAALAADSPVWVAPIARSEVNGLLTRTASAVSPPPSPPALMDGKLDEWRQLPAVTVAKPLSGDDPVWRGADDLSFRFWTAWNDHDFHLAAEVKDNAWSQPYRNNLIWRGDCLIFAFDAKDDNEHRGFGNDDFEAGLTLVDGEPTVFVWHGPHGFRGLLEPAVAAVTRDDEAGVTRYELAVSWWDMGIHPPVDSTHLGFDVAVRDNDGDGLRGGIQWTPGLLGRKMPAAFGDLVLWRKSPRSESELGQTYLAPLRTLVELPGPTPDFYLTADEIAERAANNAVSVMVGFNNFGGLRDIDVEAWVTDGYEVLGRTTWRAPVRPGLNWFRAGWGPDKVQPGGYELRLRLLSLAPRVIGDHTAQLTYYDPTAQRALANDLVNRAGKLASVPATRGNNVAKQSAAETLLYRAVQIQRDADSPWTDSQLALSVNARLEELAPLVAKAESGVDPFQGVTGRINRAYRSAVDGTLQPYATFIPANYDGKPMPCVIALHGHGSHPGQMLDRLHVELQPPGDEMIVLAPNGRGNFGFTGVGERDVWDAYSVLKDIYRIDPDRLYITGLSMGGGGALNLLLHHPDRFAAAAPVCAWSDYRVWMRDDKKWDPWVPLVVQSTNFLDLAENAVGIPVKLFHGDRDSVIGVEHARRLAYRLEQVGCSVEYVEYEGVGHNAWIPAYKDGAVFDWFARHRRNPRPDKVTLKTYGHDPDQAFWVRLDAQETPGQPTIIRASASGNVVRADVRNVLQLTFDLKQAPVADPAKTCLVVNNQLIHLGEGDHATVTVHSGWKRRGLFRIRRMYWALGPVVGADAKTSGRSGPPGRAIVDYAVTAVGKGRDRLETWRMERIAHETIPIHGSPSVEFPIRPADQVTEAEIQSANLIVIGTPTNNTIYGKLNSALPVRFEGNLLIVGDRKFEIGKGDDLGIYMAYPNPLNKQRMVVVIGGNTVRGAEAAAEQAWGAPDYLIVRASHSPDEPNDVLLAGFFDSQWRLTTASQWP